MANKRTEIEGEGIVLGAVVSKHGHFAVHSQTEAYGHVVRGVIEALTDLGHLPQSFGFTSFQFLKVPVITRHVDKNINKSFMFSCGPFFLAVRCELARR